MLIFFTYSNFGGNSFRRSDTLARYLFSILVRNNFLFSNSCSKVGTFFGDGTDYEKEDSAAGLWLDVSAVRDRKHDLM